MLLSSIADEPKVRSNGIGKMTKKKTIAAVALMAAVTAVIYMLGNKEELTSSREVNRTPAVSGAPQENVDSDIGEADPKPEVGIRNAPNIALVRSIFDVDEDVRNAAIAETEKFVVANFGIDRGLLRYEPVLIESTDIIVGDLSQSDAIAKKFQLSFLGDVSITATETQFRPLDVNNQASWSGVLDGGDSGTIQMSIQAPDVGSPYLIIRIDAPPYYYLLVPLDNMPNVYVAGEANLAFRRTMKTD